MNIYTNPNSPFPSQVVSDAEKASLEYGNQVAQAIEQEWFRNGRTNGSRYLTSWNNYHQLRLYARGEQSIQKYKDELAIMACNRHLYAPNAKVEKQPLNLSIAKYNNDGFNSQIIK